MYLRFCQYLTVLAAFGFSVEASAGDKGTSERLGSVYDALAVEQSLAEASDDGGLTLTSVLDAGETVEAAIKAALNNNPQLDIAQSRVDAAEADRFAALGQFLPDIEVSAAYSDDSLRSSSLQTLQDRDGTTLGVTAVQPISQGLSALNRYRGARASLNEADFSFTAARQQTALAAARAHASVLLMREIVEHRINNLVLLNQQYEIVRKRQKAGAQGRTGVEQSLARRAQAQVALGEARARLAENEAAFQRIVGQEAPAQIIGDAYDPKRRSASLQEAIALAEKENPSVSAAAAAFESARYSKNAAVGDFAPKVTLEGSYFQRFGEDQTLGQQGDEEYQLVARMRMPIFNQGRSIAGLRSARASVREAQARLEQTLLETAETVTRSWRQLTQAEFKRVAAKQGIAAAKQSVKGLQMEYEAGQRSVIDVLDGQRDLVQAEISLSQAEFDLRLSQYELAASTGVILQVFGGDVEPTSN